jgi:hypothetical protein
MSHSLRLCFSIVICLIIRVEIGASASQPAKSTSGCLHGDVAESFFAFIESSGAKSSVELFDKLSTHPCYSRLLTRPILNPVSFALHNQEVTTQFPRIVLHHGDLTFMLTGDPTKVSSDLLEIITFDTQKSAYRFSLVNFRAADPKQKLFKDASNVEFEQLSDPSFAGLSKCSMCHALDATESRPRWGMPPLFQVPFGQANDHIYAGSEQMQRWQEFRKTLADRELGVLYRFLQIRTRTAEDGTIEFIDQPNQALATDLERQNVPRVARILKTAPTYAQLRFALMAVLLGEEDLRGYFSTTGWQQRVAAFKTGLKERLTRNAPLLQASPKTLISLIEKDIVDYDTESVRTVLERLQALSLAATAGCSPGIFE